MSNSFRNISGLFAILTAWKLWDVHETHQSELKASTYLHTVY